MAAGESRERNERERDRNGNHYFLDGKVLTSRKSCDEDIGRTRGEEPEVKRPRPKSAPALRRRMTPQTITLPSFQVSRGEKSSEIFCSDRRTVTMISNRVPLESF